jgi:hypothetical protein
MTTVIQTAAWQQVQQFRAEREQYRAERDEAWRLASDWEQSAEDAMRALHDANVKAAEVRAVVLEMALYLPDCVDKRALLKRAGIEAS